MSTRRAAIEAGVVRASQSRLTRWLSRRSQGFVVGYASTCAFGAYFCMYGFRKPFAAATYEGQTAFGVDLKLLLVVSQVVGYALSKLLGVRFVSELRPERRVGALLTLVGIAELALFAMATLPPTWKLAAIFVSGLPLGAVWGLVFAFLEGRRTSEILGAGLSMSYIVASGAVKAVGRAVIEAGVPERFMPALTGLLFSPLFAGFVWLLSRIPPPSPEDRAARSERQPMDRDARRAFFARYAFGLSALTGLYVLLTAYRDFRDNFAYELWSAFGYREQPAVLAYAELPVALGVMVGLALIFLVRDNRRALLSVHAVMATGAASVLVATALFERGVLSGGGFMIWVGTGLYLGYVPYGCVLFDRLMATTRSVRTAVFMIYVTDAAGYLGAVSLLLWKSFGAPELDWLPFFVSISYLTGAACLAGVVASALYFARVTRPGRVEPR